METPLSNWWTQGSYQEVMWLHEFLQPMGIYLTISNQGYSVKVYDSARGRNLSLEAAVSLYNKGVASYAYRSLSKYQKKILQDQHSICRDPLTVQRSKGILVTEATRTTSEAFYALKLIRARRERLNS